MIIDWQDGISVQQKSYFIGNVPIENFLVSPLVPFLVINATFTAKQAEITFTAKQAEITFTAKQAEITFTKVE